MPRYGRSVVLYNADGTPVNPTYTEDSAHSSGDRGTFILAVRVDDEDTTLAGTDRDYAPFQVNGTGAARFFMTNDTVVTAVGGSVSSNIVPVGGSDGANARQLKMTNSGDASVSVVDMAGGDTMAYGNATLSGTAALLIASNAARRAFSIQNLDASLACYWGSDSSVTTANGTEIAANGGVDRQSALGCYTGDIYIIATGAGTANAIRYQEIDKA
jgi:hypothetical protein